MKQNLFISIVLLQLIVPIFSQCVTNIDYCTLQDVNCTNHIGCNNKGFGQNTCPPFPVVVVMSDKEKTTLLNLHNQLRSRVALGHQPGFNSASTMMKMVWDDELALLAKYNVQKCKMEPDQCAKTTKYPNVGQNLFLRSTQIYNDINIELSFAVRAWFEENQYATQNDINNCCGANSTQTSHFLQMVQDQAVAIGCAALRYPDENHLAATLLTCNYAYGNVQGAKVYSSGAPASQCPNGVDLTYPALCKPNGDNTTINPYCSFCSNNIACNNDGTFAKSCPPDVALVPLKENDRNVILYYHNVVRNFIAGGPSIGFKNAAKMTKLTWNDELAYLAELNVKKCAIESSSCVITKNANGPGRSWSNYVDISGQPSDIKNVFLKALSLWFFEYPNATQADIDHLGPKWYLFSDFVQMVKDGAKSVGCAAARYTDNSYKTTLIACNYDRGIFDGSPVYVTGSTTSLCPGGNDGDFPNLCA